MKTAIGNGSGSGSGNGNNRKEHQQQQQQQRNDKKSVKQDHGNPKERDFPD